MEHGVDARHGRGHESAIRLSGHEHPALVDAQRLLDLVKQVTTAPSSIEQLKLLADLHAQGALTDEEFAAQKAKLLG